VPKAAIFKPLKLEQVLPLCYHKPFSKETLQFVILSMPAVEPLNNLIFLPLRYQHLPFPKTYFSLFSPFLSSGARGR
jgi:hypothetical protein